MMAGVNELMRALTKAFASKAAKQRKSDAVRDKSIDLETMPRRSIEEQRQIDNGLSGLSKRLDEMRANEIDAAEERAIRGLPDPAKKKQHKKTVDNEPKPSEVGPRASDVPLMTGTRRGLEAQRREVTERSADQTLDALKDLLLRERVITI